MVSGHHLLVISSVKPLYNGKFIFKIIPEVISIVRYFSQMYKKSQGATTYQSLEVSKIKKNKKNFEKVWSSIINKTKIFRSFSYFFFIFETSIDCENILLNLIN